MGREEVGGEGSDVAVWGLKPDRGFPIGSVGLPVVGEEAELPGMIGLSLNGEKAVPPKREGFMW